MKRIAGVVGIVAVSAIIALRLLSTTDLEPAMLVQNITFETKDGLLFSEELTRYPAIVSVIPLEDKSKIGISTETFVLNFGILPRGLSVRKVIDLQNKNEFPVKVHVKSYGNISSMVQIDKEDFVLARTQSETVSLKLTAKSVGNYSGEIQTLIMKPKYSWLEAFLPWV